MANYTGLEEAWERRLFTDCCQKGTLSLEGNGEEGLCAKAYVLM